MSSANESLTVLTTNEGVPVDNLADINGDGSMTTFIAAPMVVVACAVVLILVARTVKRVKERAELAASLKE